MPNNELITIRAKLAESAGERCAQVETMAGWIDASKWNPYGLEAREKSYVVFTFDAQAMRVRETPAAYLRNLVPDDQCISGLWPVRFVER